MNERLDNPPVMDVSVSRHMGLFAVGRLAERHGIRVRLRARPPQGLIAMVWLPDSIIQQVTARSGGCTRRCASSAPSAGQADRERRLALIRVTLAAVPPPPALPAARAACRRPARSSPAVRASGEAASRRHRMVP